MKILITGGSGFIGKAITKKLIERDIEVNILDIKKTNLPKHKKIKYFNGSIFDQKKIRNAIQDCKVVIHLAGALGVNKTDNDYFNCLEVNTNGTKLILENCKKYNIKKIIYSSSSEIYGDQKKFPIYENFEPKNKSVYALSKNAAEAYVKGFSQKYKIDFNIVRFFNVYGPGQKNNFVISKFINRASNGKSLEIQQKENVSTVSILSNSKKKNSISFSK